MLPGSKLLLGWRECFVTASPVKAVMGLLITFILFLLSHVFVEGEFLLPFKNKMYMSTFPVKETDLLPYGIQSLSDESVADLHFFFLHTNCQLVCLEQSECLRHLSKCLSIV